MQSIIFIEISEGKLDPVVKQIALKLRKMPLELRGTIKGISVGNYSAGSENDLVGLVDELMVIETPQNLEYNMESVANLLADIIKSGPPSLLFMGFTHLGMELAPTVGMRLGLPTVTGCSDFSFADGAAAVKRIIHGSRLSTSMRVNLERGAIFSIQRGAFKEEANGTAAPLATPAVTRISWRETWNPVKSQVMGIVAGDDSMDVNITKANLLVSVGRGLGGPDPVPLMKNLAEKLGGMLSCSRPVVDNGWLPASRQVGSSGKTVSPVIYLALGISGQGNHVAGMGTSRIIIAVNKDAEAPIFRIAHYGVVENIHEFVPELLSQIK